MPGNLGGRFFLFCGQQWRTVIIAANPQFTQLDYVLISWSANSTDTALVFC